MNFVFDRNQIYRATNTKKNVNKKVGK